MEKLNEVDQILGDEVNCALSEEVYSLHERVQCKVEVLWIEEVNAGIVLEGADYVDHKFMGERLVEFPIIGQQSLSLVLDNLRLAEG